MGLKKLAKKVADYNERFEQGKADKIQPSHVLKVMEKLKAKKLSLSEDLLAAKTDDKKRRLERKLKIADEQIARAEWLLGEVTKKPDNKKTG